MNSTHRQRADVVQRVMQDVSDAMAVPGLVWAVASGSAADREVTIRATGDLGEDALFRVASVTKPIAAAATLHLVEKGILSLEEPVECWVPEWRNRRVLRVRHGSLDDTVASHRPLRLRDLLTMNLGLGYDMAAPDDDPLTVASHEAGIYSSWLTPDLAPNTWKERVAALPMAHQPGEGFLYQTSFDALTVVIEAATGLGFDEVLREQLLVPLEMTTTGYTVSPTDLHRVVANHFPHGDHYREVAPAADRSLRERPVFCSAATGLVSSASDLIRFAQLLLDKGQTTAGRRLLSAGAVEQMRSDALSPAARDMASSFLEPGQTWGLGAAVDGAGRFGWDGGTGTSLWVDPHAQVAGVLLSAQGMGGSGPPVHFTRFWDLVRAENWV